MALVNILSSVAADTGVSLNNSSDKAWLIAKINEVAKEKYLENDLKYCEFEQVFEFGQYAQVIALPQYIYKVISCRDYESRLPVTQIDMRPRYMSNTWRQPYIGYPYYKWRLKGKAATKQDIHTSSYLKITIPAANSALFSVIITGETVNAKKTQEVVLFPVGTTSKRTTNQFNVVESIRKSDPTDVDVSIKDIDDTELAMIANSDLSCEYQIVQVLDRNENPASTMLMEILYKPRYVAMINDYDEFVGGDLYDEALYWSVMSKLAAREKDANQQMVCHQKAEACFTRIALNKDGPIDVRLKFGKNPTFNWFSRQGQSITTARPYRPLCSNSLK